MLQINVLICLLENIRAYYFQDRLIKNVNIIRHVQTGGRLWILLSIYPLKLLTDPFPHYYYHDRNVEFDDQIVIILTKKIDFEFATVFHLVLNIHKTPQSILPPP